MKGRITVIALFGLATSACGLFGGGDEAVEPPAELVEFDETLAVEEVWDQGIGDSGEALRLGLRPASDGARIYAGAYDGRVEAYAVDSGDEQWEVDTDLPLSAGPAYADGMLAFGTSEGDLVLLDASDGSEIWRRSVGSEVLAPPAMTAGIVVLRTVDGRLRGFTTSDGSTEWTVSQNMPALTLRGNSSPVISGTTAISGFDNGRVGAYDIDSGEPAWEVAIASPTGRNELERLVDVADGIGVVGSDVYTASYQGRAVGIDLGSGNMIWQEELSSFAGLGVDVNNVYVATEDGTIVALGRRSGTELWRQPALARRDVTAPTRYEGSLVVGDFEGYLHWMSPEDGTFVARERIGGDRVTSAPIVVNRTLVAQTADGSIAAFRIERDDEESD